MPLRIHTELPPGILDCDAEKLHQHLGGPTLLRLAGELQPAAVGPGRSIVPVSWGIFADERQSEQQSEQEHAGDHVVRGLP